MISETRDARGLARDNHQRSLPMLVSECQAPAFSRLSPQVIDATCNWLTTAIRGETRDAGVAVVRRLRAIVDESVPERPRGPFQLGALPDVLGTVVTLQYPLMQLEQFLSGAPSDIASIEQAELYLSFTRYHLWKLQQLLRDLAGT